MKIHTIEPGTFKLDGGATFGVVPKTLWSKVYPADDNNLCLFALRLLLIEQEDRKILIDTGIGNKQPEDFYKYYFREGHHSIEKALQDKGFAPEEVTDVILTHLHFDHVGGAVKLDEKDNFVPTFPNANHYISKKQWEWALNPNQRERASFLKENILPLHDAGLISFIEQDCEIVPGIGLRLFSGHTDGLLVPFIAYQGKTLIYTNDLLALSAQIPASWVCGYDTKPLVSMQERAAFMQEAMEYNYYLVFQHDAYTECCTLKQTEKGIRIDQTYQLEQILK